MGTDNHAYLLSIVAFIRAGNRVLIPGSLSAACFWVGLRQEIYSAMMTQRPVWIDLDNGLVDRSLEPADDHTWANRAVVHCADVLSFCFGDNTHHVASRWQELDHYGRRWTEAIPPSFTPLYQDNSSTEPFPEIWHQDSCHAIGIQHHLLAELFLARYNPKVPRIGANRKVAEAEIAVRAALPSTVRRDTVLTKTRVPLKDRIQKLTRRIIGIGLGNQWTPPALFTACMAVAGCKYLSFPVLRHVMRCVICELTRPDFPVGDHFHSRDDKQAMLQMLKITERDHARPTETIQHMCG